MEELLTLLNKNMTCICCEIINYHLNKFLFAILNRKTKTSELLSMNILNLRSFSGQNHIIKYVQILKFQSYITAER